MGAGAGFHVNGPGRPPGKLVNKPPAPLGAGRGVNKLHSPRLRGLLVAMAPCLASRASANPFRGLSSWPSHPRAGRGASAVPSEAGFSAGGRGGLESSFVPGIVPTAQPHPPGPPVAGREPLPSGQLLSTEGQGPLLAPPPAPRPPLRQSPAQLQRQQTRSCAGLCPATCSLVGWSCPPRPPGVLPRRPPSPPGRRPPLPPTMPAPPGQGPSTEGLAAGWGWWLHASGSSHAQRASEPQGRTAIGRHMGSRSGGSDLIPEVCTVLSASGAQNVPQRPVSPGDRSGSCNSRVPVGWLPTAPPRPASACMLPVTGRSPPGRAHGEKSLPVLAPAQTGRRSAQVDLPGPPGHCGDGSQGWSRT